MLNTIRPLLLDKGYELLDYINKGGFGSCYLVRSTKYQMNFVCKISQNPEYESKYLNSFSREVNALTHLNHPNVVRVYDVFTIENYLAIILEYCSGGTLHSRLDEFTRIPIDKTINYTRQILDALCYMHSKGK